MLPHLFDKDVCKAGFVQLCQPADHFPDLGALEVLGDSSAAGLFEGSDASESCAAS